MCILGDDRMPPSVDDVIDSISKVV
jgi:hypothetical protein